MDNMQNFTKLKNSLLARYNSRRIPGKEKNKVLDNIYKITEIEKNNYRLNEFIKNGMMNEAREEKNKINSLISNINEKGLNSQGSENTVLKGGISNTVYIWHSSENACEKCQALDGKKFYYEDDIPEKPHPNCKCFVEEIQDDDELCDCYLMYDELEKLILNYNSLETEINYEISDIENIISHAENTAADFDATLGLLEKEYGKHLPECENNIDAIYEQLYAQKFELLVLINDITGLLNPLKTLLGTVYSFVTNYIHLLSERDGTMDKFYHSKANCEAAQRGILGSAIADGLSNLKELYDSYTYVHTHKVTKEQAIADSERDQVANREGRERGRNNPVCSCYELMWDLRPEHRKNF